MKQVIIMADVIDSRVRESKKLMREFKHIVNAANKTFQRSLKSPLTITLGDEFQGIVKGVKKSLELIIYIEEALIHKNYDFKLRFVLMEGLIETTINKKIAFEMLGPGLTKAREMLTSMKESNSRFYVALDNQLTTDVLNNAFVVYQALIHQWKREKDYALVSGFLKYNDYKKVSEKLKKNRSQIWKREKTLNIQSYQAIKNIIYTTVKL